ncbi:MAG: alkaline phosphatase family protein [Nanoarchaeota archaeon]|nr:alkaline phosphatase family protein [Nanoarchaeota archaeon]
MTKRLDRIALIIIDQLRADYREYFTNCARVLRYSSICDTNSIPTSTEAMHANISTGKYPKEHGFISKCFKEKDGDALEELLQKYLSKKLTPISSIGFINGYKTFCFGGKREVVQSIASARDCTLMIHPNKNKSTFKADDEGESFWKEIFFAWKNNYVLPKEIPNKLSRLDIKLINLFEEIINTSKDYDDKFFYLLTLPSLDFIGHKHGPHSDEAISHIKCLDENISEIIKSNENTLFIIAGDHGARRTLKYIIEVKKNTPNAHVYHRERDLYRHIAEIPFDSEENFQHICYDGGILRIWMKRKNNLLTKRDAKMLAKYGTIIDLRLENKNIESKYFEIIQNSNHENLGDIIVVANKDATFCKRSWIDRKVLREKIPRGQNLRINELPVGEHGTYFDEDRHTLILSNYDFRKHIVSNLQIREELEKIMGST